ncbi:baeRF3 domain-containing protein [Nocardioides pinisoli]|uniref:Chemotaxis protein n=1 Tax=Nocardioides pinisoli TaxID=2950279 RepID=A0ABT1KRB9_9ACTN|nr:hypothetical protein [Nocardioides pinisoli]MCP3420285.1 hypothetical protein [Nocardioides pinisoli]
MSAGAIGSPVALRTRDIADLAVTAGYPCISVLLPTEPAPRMTPADRSRLDDLVRDAAQCLVERSVTNRSRLLDKLSDQVDRASDEPTDRGLCIYVNRAVARSFRLPQPVAPRAVVESTFATRPLISALHRMPPHLVLLVHPTCAHLYASEDGGLRPVGRHEPFGSEHSIRVPGPRQPAAAATRAEVTTGFLRGVDQLLGDYRSDHPSPLVLVGPPRLLDEFCALSGNLERLAGRVDDRDCATILDLALAGITAVEAYLRTRREDALALLRRAAVDRPMDVASGIEGCWRALGRRRPAMLLVEEDFIVPGTTVPGRGTPGGAPAVAEVHDLVDDLMEQVILTGGQLALVADGDLAGHDRIALVLRH